MADKKVWLATGAGRGMGVDIAKAALAAGHAVVATGRNPQRVSSALGAHDDLLAVKLDVTSLADAKDAARAAVERFGHIDVLVNNAGNFYAGFFEEISPQDFRAQVETTLFGPMNVTRAVLPVMRAQRSGLVVAISSTAGIVGQEFCTAYAAAKFGVEGWIESLAPEVAPSASTRCWSSPASSAPSCSARSRPTTPSPQSTTTPSAPPRPSLPGTP
jgi:NAD(P)-dependent dehydrogenase (short-subunit alcohol dehydrogenase family)